MIALVCTLALAGALSWTTLAAPITGSFTVDIVFFPQHSGQNKIDLIDVKFEADLILTLSISGLDLTSTTLFTFKGVEVQIFSAKATVGAMTFSTVLVFAPNIIEFETVRAGSQSLGWCVRQSAPVNWGVPPGLAHCGQGFSAGVLDPNLGFFRFFDLFLGTTLFVPGSGPIDNLVLGKWADGLSVHNRPSMLDPALTFRKKVSEVTLSIAGLTLGLRALFANFGGAPPAPPSFETGLVLILSGTTVSGITVRSETWVGARQGFECFGECKPLSRLGFTFGTYAPQPASAGIVVSDPAQRLQPQEEKLYLTGVSLAGVRCSVALEMVFAGAGASSLQPTSTQLDCSARVAPLGITVRNIARFGAGLSFARDIILFGITIGEASTTVQIDLRPTVIGAFSPLFTALTITFDPQGGSATIVVINCQPDAIFGGIIIGLAPACYGPNSSFPIAGAPAPFLEVDYALEFEVGDLSVSVGAITFGSLLKDLVHAELLAKWAIGNVTITSWTIFVLKAPDFTLGDPRLGAQQFSVEVKF
jgi:hypothetical protein